MGRQGIEAGVERPAEWIGAVVPLPSYVTDDGAPYRPSAVMWLEPESGVLVDTELVRPEQALARAAGLFQLATREPRAGEPRVPRRLRVSDVALASALRGSVGDVELVVAPTPEMDDVIGSLVAHMSTRRESDEEKASDDGWTFIGPDTEADDVGEMFAAAARLFEAAPWNVIPSDTPMGVSCDVLGIEDGVIVVVGQLGQAHGFSLFSNLDDAVKFFDAVDANERGERLPIPLHMMFSFDDRREMHPRLVAEIAEHGWAVANERAYPNPLMIDEDRVTRGLTRVELAGVTAIMTALARLIETEPAALVAAWKDEDEADDIVWNETVRVGLGDVDVQLRAPDDSDIGGHDHDHQQMAAVESFLDEDGNIDREIFADFAHALMHELEEVPHIEEWHLRCAEILIVGAVQNFGLPITRLTAAAMEELLFRHLTTGAVLEPRLARYVVETAQLIMAYADETLGIETALRCRTMLSLPTMVEALASAFANAEKANKVAKKPAAKKAPAKKAKAAKKAPAKKAKPAKARPVTKAKSKAASPKKKPRR